VAELNPFDDKIAIKATCPNCVLGGHLKTGHTWTLQNRPTK
jgi:hypothetical protein